MMYDPEVPAGFQDADFEMAEMTELANRIHYLNKSGKCTHEGVVGRPANGMIYYPQQERITGKQKACTDCDAIFDDDDDWWRKRQLVINGF